MDEDGQGDGDEPVEPEPGGDDGGGGLEVEEGGAEEGLGVSGGGVSIGVPAEEG